ncbi:MAG: hypothetical protein H6595_10805 [Flavobacteriales bacterium]|nr:hypothetical protein [Flavobacteriales bacterium]MCB9167951.1 hypothetical protein [Flavobacteriales bacterium]
MNSMLALILGSVAFVLYELVLGFAIAFAARLVIQRMLSDYDWPLGPGPPSNLPGARRDPPFLARAGLGLFGWGTAALPLHLASHYVRLFPIDRLAGMAVLVLPAGVVLLALVVAGARPRSVDR